jgi:large subunit ribosomal protein L4
MADKPAAPADHSLPVKTLSGESGKVSIGEAALGGMVKNRLMHSAAVMYHANTRAGTHCTKARGEVTGSTKKLYRQKGTGRARAGNRKAGQRKHGGIIHGPKPRKYGFEMPKKQRRAAVNSSVLAKIKDGEVQVVDGFGVTAIKTKAMHDALVKLSLLVKGKNPSLLILTDGIDKNVHMSCRNMEGVMVLPVQDLNAREVLTHNTVVFTKAAFERFGALAARTYEKKPRKLKGTRKSDAPSAPAPSAPAAAAGK